MNFKELNLNDVIKEIIDYRGKTPKKLGGKWSENGIRALSAKNIKTGKVVQEETIRFVDRELYKKWMKQEVERGTILITSEAPFGEILYWNSDEKIVLSQRIFGVKIKSIYNSQYIYYYMTTPKFKSELNARATGSTVTGLRQPELLKCKIKIPEKKYQDKIVKILSSIDNKIQLNNQINDNLLKLNNELYEKYFIENVEENTATIELEKLITVINGYSYKGNELVEKSNIGMATIKNFERKGGFKEEGFKALNPSKLKLEQIVEINDILVACTDLTQQADIIGNAILLLGKAEFEKIVISMDLVKIIPKEGINKFIIYSILNSKEFKNFALGYKSGTTVLHLNKKCFSDYKIKLPNEDILKRFSIIVENNYKKISNILEENRRLEKLRDTLLPKLMNGKIDLDKVEI